MTGFEETSSKQYLDLLDITDKAEALDYIKSLAGNISEEHHTIRSCIFLVHASVEIELRRIIYHHLKKLLFVTDDNEAEALKDFEKMVDKLGFMDMYRLLKPMFKYWPDPDLNSIQAINDTQNQAAHSYDFTKVSYKGRNPFHEVDCLAQLYFDSWAVRSVLRKYFSRAIEEPEIIMQRYYEKYGSI